MTADQWMRSTFEPRDLPKVIMFNDGEIIGPFCIHCGGTQEFHSKAQRCPRRVGILWPSPICSCHAVTTNARPPRPGDEVSVLDADGWRRATVTDEGKIRR